jgi:hypothetical protein
MRWITGIKLNNYKAFRGEYDAIEIPPKNHLLIYGENGSGKSSIYQSLKDFFYSSVNTDKTFELNHFSMLADENAPGSIEIKIAELDENGKVVSNNPFRFAKPDEQSTHRIQPIKLANKVKGFLDYKRMLRTHFIPTKPGKNPNLFPLVIEDLLSDHLIHRVDGGVTTYPLGSEWKRYRETIYKLDKRYKEFNRIHDEMPTFEQLLRQLLINVFTEFRRLISEYFDPKLEIDVSLSQLECIPRRWRIKQELFFNIKYAGAEITEYHLFLNEARLSALALCLYLAALKTYPPEASDLKIIYLDDVFIGLDTSNRIPLLKIINKEFINEGFQIFISTYDRSWYETTRNFFETENQKFKTIELFVNDQNNDPATPDIPVIIDPGLDYFERAKAYFKAKDFPATANYLRKSCESELRRILPAYMTLLVDHNTDEVRKISKLEILVDNFFTYLDKNGLNQAPFQHFKTYKKIILNPLSHDDLETPHYRNEIQDGINLVENLKNIKSKAILKATDSAEKPLKLGMRDMTTKGMHIYEIQLLENLQLLQQAGSPVQLSSINCEVREGTTKRKFETLNLAFDQLRIERGYLASANYDDFYNHIKVSNRKKLIDIMTFD